MLCTVQYNIIYGSRFRNKKKKKTVVGNVVHNNLVARPQTLIVLVSSLVYYSTIQYLSKILSLETSTRKTKKENRDNHEFRTLYDGRIEEWMKLVWIRQSITNYNIMIFCHQRKFKNVIIITIYLYFYRCM